MGKKYTRTLEILALFISICCLTSGFLAYSQYIRISSNLMYNQNDLNFKVIFSTTKDGKDVGIIESIIQSDNSNFKATNAIIDNSGNPTIKNIDINFTAPGQKVTYKFYAYNSGDYTAYLKNIVYNSVSNLNKNKICLSNQNQSYEQINSWCDNIKISIKVNELNTTKTLSNIKNMKIVPRESQEIEVTIEYLYTDKPIGDNLEVIFGDITLYYSMTK